MTLAFHKKKAPLRRLVLSCMVGNALEWYDFSLYAVFLEFIMATAMPSTSSGTNGVFFLGFWVFFVGFLARPLGALVFGYIGDAWGREKALMLSIYGMTLSTLIIGFLPSHKYFGVGSLWLLNGARILQGLSLGGEFSGSMITITERAPEGKKGSWGSFVSFSAVAGICAGLVMAWALSNLLDPSSLASWGWRLPFFVAIGGSIAGWNLRRSGARASIHAVAPCPDSPEPLSPYAASSSCQRFSWKSLLLQYPLRIFQVSALDAVVAAGFFIVTSYIINYLLMYTSLTYPQAASINMMSMIIFAVVTLVAGYISDHFGSARVMAFGVLALTCLAVPCFYLLSGGTLLAALWGQGLMGCAMGCIFGPLPSVITFLFPRHIRYTGVSLSHNLSMTFLGGSMPLLCDYFIRGTGSAMAPAYILMLACLVSFGVLAHLLGRPNLGKI